MTGSPAAGQGSRERFLHHLRSGDVVRARREVRALLAEHSGPREWSFISREIGRFP